MNKGVINNDWNKYKIFEEMQGLSERQNSYEEGLRILKAQEKEMKTKDEYLGERK